jgi:type IV pilus assembly protein PilO
MKSLRNLFTLLNLHIAGVVLLLGLNIFIGVKLVLAWHAIAADKPENLAGDQIRYQQLQAQSAKLGILPEKVGQARTDANTFYDKRYSMAWSQVLAELGRLETKDSVRLTRAGYTEAPAINGLTDIRVDASLSGDYTPIVRFINDLERDKERSFFLINTLTLTGQQGGLVNLRLRLTTFLRPPHPGEAMPVAEPSSARTPAGPGQQPDQSVTPPPDQEVQ